jgi:MarR family 2-MHQ and catechol resistance regulon transcriptional repressor
MDNKSSASLDLWNKLSFTYDTLQKAHSRRMYVNNLTAPQFHVLQVLYNEGPMPLKRISEHLLVTGANITCVVDNLEKEDFVKRVPSKKDRRVINAELTGKGEEKVKKLFPQYSKGFDDSFSKLTKDEKKQLVKILDKIA